MAKTHWIALFQNWFTLQTIAMLVLIGIIGFCEGIFFRFPRLLVFLAILHGSRHLTKVGILFAAIRILIEITICYSILVFEVVVLFMYLAIFVPDAFSH